MKRINNILLQIYSGNEFPYLIYTIMGFVTWIYYRASTINLASQIYSDINITNKFALYKIAAHYDLMAFAIFAATLFVLFLFSHFARFTVSVIAGSLVFLQFAFARLCLDFFRVYETSFQRSFVGGEQFSGVWSMVKSAFAEISFQTFIYLLILLISIILLAIGGELASFHLFDKGEFKLFRIRSVKIAISITLMSFTSVAIIPTVNIDNIVSKQSADSKRANLILEISLNPLCSLFFEKRETIKHNIVEVEQVLPASVGLNTDSIENATVFPDLNIIPKGKKYNVIIYLFESTPMKYYDLVVKGTTVLPVMKRMAENSVFLNMHYANYPLSANAMFSILTSDYPMFGKDMVLEKMPKIPIKTISEVLHSNGYRTCYMHTGDLGYAGQKKFLSHRSYDKIITSKQLFKQPGFNYEVGWGADERSMIVPAVNFIKEATEPFFMVISPMNPHHPYAIPDKSFDISGASSFKGRDKMWNDYINSLHYADFALGELVDRLEKEGLMENTLFLMIADHGEAFYQHKMNYNHPLFVYEENVHVPALIYNKSIFKSKVNINKITRHIDILPTFLDVLGIEDTESREGVSVFKSSHAKMCYIHTSWKDEISAVRDYRWKYIYRVKDKQEELYDLDNDPDEKINLSILNSDITTRYRDFVLKGIDYQVNFYKNFINAK